MWKIVSCMEIDLSVLKKYLEEGYEPFTVIYIPEIHLEYSSSGSFRIWLKKFES